MDGDELIVAGGGRGEEGRPLLMFFDEEEVPEGKGIGMGGRRGSG